MAQPHEGTLWEARGRVTHEGRPIERVEIKKVTDERDSGGVVLIEVETDYPVETITFPHEAFIKLFRPVGGHNGPFAGKPVAPPRPP